ncbi:hypothetical protein C8R45DRAFT_1159587 [Mycena sanguinolenta]|nr:hypothetical protein C8R45DRAFT_1159587 [Mycena sanguinolenta]
MLVVHNADLGWETRQETIEGFMGLCRSETYAEMRETSRSGTIQTAEGTGASMRLPGMGSTGPVRSSRYQALKQMLVTLTRLDKLAAACRVFTLRGMMTRTTSSYTARVAAGFQPQVTTATTAAASRKVKDHYLHLQ